MLIYKNEVQLRIFFLKIQLFFFKIIWFAKHL